MYWDWTENMRKNSLTVIGVSAIGGAFSIFVRWLQNTIIFDAETGLARRGAGISWALVLLCVLVAAAELLVTLRLRSRLSSDTQTELLRAGSKWGRIFFVAMAGLTLLGGILHLISSLTGARQGVPVLDLILSVLAIAAGAALLVLALGKAKDGASRCFCYAAAILFYCFWLIVCYKDNANDPVIWKFCMQILSIGASALGWYYAAGFAYDHPQPAKTLFFCQLAAFLGILVMADERSIGAQLLLLCPALMLLGIASRLVSADKTPSEEKAE